LLRQRSEPHLLLLLESSGRCVVPAHPGATHPRPILHHENRVCRISRPARLELSRAAAELSAGQSCTPLPVPARRYNDRLPLESRLRFDWSGRACIAPPARVSSPCNECPYQPLNEPRATFHHPGGRNCCRGFDRNPYLCQDVLSKAPSLRRTPCNQPADGRAVSRPAPVQSKFAYDDPERLHDRQYLRY